MSKYELVRRSLDEAISAGGKANLTEDEVLETVLVVAVERLVKCAGRKRTADALRYELSNVGGDVDTVFLRSR